MKPVYAIQRQYLFHFTKNDNNVKCLFSTKICLFNIRSYIHIQIISPLLVILNYFGLSFILQSYLIPENLDIIRTTVISFSEKNLGIKPTV